MDGLWSKFLGHSVLNERTKGNCEEELPKKPVGRQTTDSLPTANQQGSEGYLENNKTDFESGEVCSVGK